MKKPHLPKIRKILRDHPDGMTVNQIHELLPEINRPHTIRKCLLSMPDSYVDRWTISKGNRGQYEKVWCVVVPPSDCPHPKDRWRETPKSKWVVLQV